MSTPALKGPYWVTVRQYRRTLWLTGALVLAALAVIGGLRVWDLQYPDVYVEDGYRRVADDNSGYQMLRGAMGQFSVAMVLLPFLTGAFVAGPLVAREFESGTYKLSLTQSVGPAAWLRAKLLTTTAVAVGTTLVLTAVYLIGWGRVSGTWQFHWADRGPYETTGTVLVSYVLLAVAVGALVGQLVRRTLLAMAVAGGLVGVVMLVLGSFRWDFLAVRTITGPALENTSTLMVPGDGLLVEQGLIGASGQRLPGWFCSPDVPAEHCRPDEAIAAQYIDYHPASHFWPTQLIETGILLALAALAALAAFRVLRARHP
ncbi:ABC transporter permease subunit [Streptomyces sp. WAC08241]|uniref:ABC transporter permease subunit n=1 Tax=Streptomyces sp. WAC08241 TaxID=2487421 RepID=UPI000F787105|nr:ABC transporter permease subunit [Streptomyces sp. WAC08241]RSS36244.1 ABC transporter permease [Streptomyces sp. WAC08241]